MDILYKYTNFHGMDSITKPVIRLSPVITLNDPFESIMNLDVKENIINTNKARDIGISNHAFTRKFEKEIVISRVEQKIASYGIVSLSETPRNILMWAHYASEHSGICIGFKKNLFESLPNKIFDPVLGVEQYTPVKVNYDNLRPQIINEFGSENEKIKAYIYQQLTTKSDDWMYEKEHRCIIPIEWADELKITSPLREKLIEEGDARIEFHTSNGFIKQNERGCYEGELLYSLNFMLKNNKGAVILKRIDCSSIASIHFGCRFNLEDKNKIISLVSDINNGLSHIKLFQCKPSHNRFEIAAEQITGNIN